MQVSCNVHNVRLISFFRLSKFLAYRNFGFRTAVTAQYGDLYELSGSSDWWARKVEGTTCKEVLSACERNLKIEHKTRLVNYAILPNLMSVLLEISVTYPALKGMITCWR